MTVDVDRDVDQPTQEPLNGSAEDRIGDQALCVDLADRRQDLQGTLDRIQLVAKNIDVELAWGHRSASSSRSRRRIGAVSIA